MDLQIFRLFACNGFCLPKFLLVIWTCGQLYCNVLNVSLPVGGDAQLFFWVYFSIHINTLLWFSEEGSKRRLQRSKDFKDVEKASHVPIQERNSNCKFPTLKLVLVIIICGTFVTLLHSPAVHNTDGPSDSLSRYVLLLSVCFPLSLLVHIYFSMCVCVCLFCINLFPDIIFLCPFLDETLNILLWEKSPEHIDILLFAWLAREVKGIGFLFFSHFTVLKQSLLPAGKVL